MKTPFFLRTCILLCLLLGACSKDSDDDGNNDITISLNEYPSLGTTIATLQSNLEGTVLYAVTFESVQNALVINSGSGALTTGDPFAYDFESDAIVTGRVTASNGTDVQTFEITITVNDIDDIEYVLSESKSDYQDAIAGEWLEITQKEYDSLFTIINNISLVGSNDNDYNGAAEATSFEYHPNTTVANEGTPLPKDEYLFAFKYISSATEVNEAKVKVSETSVSSGYEDFGSVFPNHGADEVYFVLKGNEVTYPEDAYLAMYSEKGIAWDPSYYTEPARHYLRGGDTNTIADNLNTQIVLTICLYQGLSTPIKQWN